MGGNRADRIICIVNFNTRPEGYEGRKEKIMENLYTIKDIVKENKNGGFLAICESGNAYECSFVAEFRTMFFAIPSTEKILGYTKIIGRI